VERKDQGKEGVTLGEDNDEGRVGMDGSGEEGRGKDGGPNKPRTYLEDVEVVVEVKTLDGTDCKAYVSDHWIPFFKTLLTSSGARRRCNC
jgi:hypothetical protein